jgi:O-antigen/teichoic acid export membrane protein
LGLLGEEFTAGGWVLVIMLAANVVSAVDGPVGFVVSLSGEERLYAWIMGVHAVAAIALTSLAALVHDVELVALASMAVVTSWNVCLVVVARRRFGVRCWPRPSLLRRG